MQAVILAGGKGTRLGPLTTAVNKHFLPIFDKPMIYYPLTTAIVAGASSIVIVCNPDDLADMTALIGNGDEFGIPIKFAIQTTSGGVADAILSSEPLVERGQPILVILGDNVLFGPGLGRQLLSSNAKFEANLAQTAVTFGYQVKDPNRFGVCNVDEDGALISISEKPSFPSSNIVSIGLYAFPPSVFERVRALRPSLRGELEVSDLQNSYCSEGRMMLKHLPRGTVWLDAGTPKSLMEASEFVNLLQSRTGQLIGSPHEAAARMDLISETMLHEAITLKFRGSDYLAQVMDALSGK